MMDQEPKGSEASVSDPQNYGEGRNRYTAYLVESSGVDKAEVRRRYSDFQLLYQQLQDERPGAIVPIIPHKQAVRESVRFSEELLEERTYVLQKFLGSVVTHPELHDAQCLKTFLTAYAEEWEAIRKENGTAVQRPSVFNNLTKKITGTANQLAGQPEPTPDDGAMEIIDDYLTHLESQVKIWAKESSNIVKQASEQAKSLQNIGQAMKVLGTKPYPQAYTDSTGQLAAKLSTHIGDISIVQLKYSEQASTRFEDPMQDMARSVQAAKLALSKRKDVLWDYSRKTQVVRKKKTLLEQLKVTEQEVTEAQQEAKATLKEVEVVSKRVRREIERFRDDFYEQLSKSIYSFTKLEMEYHGHVGKKWSGVLPLVQDENEEPTSGSSQNGGASAARAPAPASAPPVPPKEMVAVDYDNQEELDKSNDDQLL